MRRTLIALAAGWALVATMALPAGAAVVTAHPGGGHGGGHHGGHGGHHGGHHRGPDGHYFVPGHDGRYYDGSCPDGGYYDADGMYWYWDPGADAYMACPRR